MFHNIPDVLKVLPNFICWRSIQETPNSKPVKKPINALTGELASPTNPEHWTTFENALLAAPYCSGIGFVLSDNIPFSVIDLDDPYELNPDGSQKYDNPAEIATRQQLIAQVFDSYQEISPSGRGLHVWVKGKVPSGGRREAVEVYSSGRYITVTGNVFNNAQIKQHHDKLNQLWAEIKADKPQTSTVDKPQTTDDYTILTWASQAANGYKFIELYEGRFEQFYPSQSEADFALVDILAFYTQNREQITRIFRTSALGQRDKAKRNQYVNYMLDRCFDRMLPELDMDGLKNNLEQQLAVIRQEEAVKSQLLAVNSQYQTVKESEEITVSEYIDSDMSKYTHLSIPPGLLGDIAKFIYAAAPRPVPEVAIAGAIGLMSGICGRSYNISGTGLNTYTFLLAKTGRGKEAMGRGMNKLITCAAKTVPAATTFIGPSRISSPQALVKFLSKSSNSFVSILGEFADTLKRMSNDSRNPIQQDVRIAMLDLYNKSGKGDVLGSLIYSDKDKNTDVFTSPSFSIIGEATPEKFYELLSKHMIDEGLLPRCTIIEYEGDRTQLNENHNDATPSRALSDYFSALCAYSLQLNNGNNVINVELDSESQQILNDFNKKCDEKINKGDAIASELWSRAHVKVLKLSALLAVGCNYIHPVINKECATWALRLINTEISNLIKRFESGEIGVNNNQNDQIVEIRKALVKYVTASWSIVQKIPGATLHTHNNKVIPYSFLSSVCRQKTCFKNDKLGPIQAMKTCITAMVEADEIRELDILTKRKQNLPVTAKLYMIAGLKV